MATHVELSIDVEVPVRTAYDQWTQFEDFPRFMGGVERVVQVGDSLTRWTAQIAGVRREWDAAILEQVPDQKVAWAATTGATNAGAVRFEALGPDRTRVHLTLDYEPEGMVERVGDVLDVVRRQATADLDRFKRFVEARGAATGGWRGEIHEGGAPAPAAPAGPGGPTVGAAAGSGVGVAGFGTNTGMSSEDPASGVVTGNPGADRPGGAGSSPRVADTVDRGADDPDSNLLSGYPGERVSHSDAGGEARDDPAAGVLTGYEQPGTGEREPDDPAAPVLGGYPGAREPHTATGGQGTGESAAGIVTGFPGERTRSHTDPEPAESDRTD